MAKLAGRPMRRWLGIAVWGTVLAAFAAALVPAGEGSSSVPHGVSLTHYLLGRTGSVRLPDGTGLVRTNDPVFSTTGDRGWWQAGYVREVHVTPAGSVAEIAWFDPRHDPSMLRFELHENRGRIQDVVAMMLPPEKRERIRDRLANAAKQHAEEVTAALKPLVQQSLRDAIPLVEQELRRSLQRHREELDRLARRLNRELVNERVVPLAQQEILPIVREHAQPVAETIGQELWNRASIWRFGWRAVYDKSPLPNKDLVRGEWDRFVDEEAVPVVEQHTDEIVNAIQATIADVIASRAIRREVAAVAEDLLSDAEAARLLDVILRESLADNERLKERWREIWTSEQAKAAVSLIGDRMEPVVRQIGDELFGTRETGIDPQFARVLRNQILGKDRRWLVALPSDPADVASTSVSQESIELAEEPMVFPVIHLASELPEERS